MNLGNGPRRLAIESMWRWASRRESAGARGFLKGVVVLIGVLGSPLHAYQYWKREKEEKQEKLDKGGRVPISFDDALHHFMRTADQEDKAIGQARVMAEKASFLSVRSNEKLFEYFHRVAKGHGPGSEETMNSMREAMRTGPDKVFRAARLALLEPGGSDSSGAIKRALGELSDAWEEYRFAGAALQSRDLAQRLDRRIAEAADPEDQILKSHPYPADRKTAMREAILARVAALESRYESDGDKD